MVIDSNPKGGDRLKTLAQRETFWIEKLQATKPSGLNEDIDFSVFFINNMLLLSYFLEIWTFVWCILWFMFEANAVHLYLYISYIWL